MPLSVVAFAPVTFKKCGKAKAPAALSTRNEDSESDISFEALQDKHVLVVGGSGRVGGSVVTQLIKRGAKVTVGGTNVNNFQQARARWQGMFDSKKMDISSIQFAALNRERSDSVASILQDKDFDLVVHTAGPFQGKATTPNGVIDACVENSVPYVDVCDDYCTASVAKTRYFQKAEDSKVPCIISTGCWVGSGTVFSAHS